MTVLFASCVVLVFVLCRDGFGVYRVDLFGPCPRHWDKLLAIVYLSCVSLQILGGHRLCRSPNVLGFSNLSQSP